LAYRGHMVDVDVQPLSFEHSAPAGWIIALLYFVRRSPHGRTHQRRIAVLMLIALPFASIILLSAGCATSPARATPAAPQPAVAPPGSTTGGADARSAVGAFPDAAQSGDTQARAAAWGS